MFTDATLGLSQEGTNLRDDDGAKRVFFGGERFIEGIAGEAYVIEYKSSVTFLNVPYYNFLKYLSYIMIRSQFRELI